MDKPTETDLGQCSQRVWDGWDSRSCTRKTTVMRGTRGYCKQHDPENIKAKEEKTLAQWQAERDKEKADRLFLKTVTAQCLKVNPTNPLSVANQIEAAFKALEGIFNLANGYTEIPKDVVIKTVGPILAEAHK